MNEFPFISNSCFTLEFSTHFYGSSPFIQSVPLLACIKIFFIFKEYSTMLWFLPSESSGSSSCASILQEYFPQLTEATLTSEKPWKTVEDISSFFFHKQNWARAVLLCWQVSPHFCSALLYSQFRSASLRRDAPCERKSHPTLGVVTREPNISPWGLASALFLTLVL
jgi:hypothetical protein